MKFCPAVSAAWYLLIYQLRKKKSGRKIDLAEVIIAYLTEEAEEEVWRRHGLRPRASQQQAKVGATNDSKDVSLVQQEAADG